MEVERNFKLLQMTARKIGKFYSDAGKVGNKKLLLEIILKDSKIRHKQETIFEEHDEQHDMKIIYYSQPFSFKRTVRHFNHGVTILRK
jgi:hypothetical protein